MFGLFKKDTILVEVAATFMVYHGGQRHFAHQTFYVSGTSEDDCAVKFKARMKKLKADNITITSTEKLADDNFLPTKREYFIS